MTTRMKAAFWFYLAMLVALTAWGVSFVLRSEFTAYHSVAIGMPWSEVPPNFQILA